MKIIIYNKMHGYDIGSNLTPNGNITNCNSNRPIAYLPMYVIVIFTWLQPTRYLFKTVLG